MLLSDVCLSVAYIGPKSRTESPRKTKIGGEVAHVTRDSDTTFKVKRSKVNLQGLRHIVSPRAQLVFVIVVVVVIIIIIICLGCGQPRAKSEKRIKSEKYSEATDLC